MKILIRPKWIIGILTILLMLTLLVAVPPTYADDNSGGLPPVPSLPARNGHFPGYHPVKTTGSVIAPGTTPSVPFPSKLPAPGPASPSWGNGVKQICAAIPSPAGIATVTGGQLIADYITGDLWFYNTAKKTCTMIQTPPTGFPSPAFSWGLAVTGTLVAVSSETGVLYTCTYSSTTHTCGKESSLITISPTFCTAESFEKCNPNGMAFDKSKNLWYADSQNYQEVELTKASHYSSVGTVNSFSTEVVAVAIDSGGNHWVVDQSCSGNLYENGVVMATAGDALSSVAISTQNPSHTAHFYVGVTNLCLNYASPFIGDISDFTALPSPFSSGVGFNLPGISTLLYFTGDGAWQTGDAL